MKLTDAQKTKIQEFATAQGEKMGEVFQGGFDQEKFAAFQKEQVTATEKLIKDNLKPDQQKRAKEIQYQAGNVGTFNTNEEVQKALKLTDAQKEKFRTLAEDRGRDRGELMQGAGGGGRRGGGGGRGLPPELQQKLNALDKQYMDKAVAELNDEQKKMWKEMTGAPFTGTLGGGGFGFGRGRRGGGG
jgi:hypothetical protein